jgi:Flp pilus assembly protein protease CpaA
MLDTMTTSVAAAILIAGTITDLKWREVPDWINYAGITAGLGIRLIYAIGTQNARVLTDGLLGFGIFLLLAFAMYYLGQWGGGDSKLLMALGALLGIDLTLDGAMIAFLFNLILLGGAYGLVYCAGLAIKHKRTFRAAYTPLWHDEKYKRIRILSYILAAIILLATLFVPDILLKLAIAITAGALVLTAHATIFVKAVENCCMYQRLAPTKLTEGDWIAEDIIIGKNCIVNHRTVGVTRDQIDQLITLQRQHKLKHVLVKTGIPFVPSFFLAFAATKIFGNLLLLATAYP